MAALKRLFSKNRKYNTLKRETEARRLALILEKHRIGYVLDVGANAGQTVEGLRRSGYLGKIISFEPIKQCHDELVAKSAADPNWSIAPRCALGDKDGSAELLVSEGSSLSSINSPTEAMTQAMPKVRAAAREKVPIHRLDRLMKDEIAAAGGAFLKVDAQGHDMKVLKGAEGIMGNISSASRLRCPCSPSMKARRCIWTC